MNMDTVTIIGMGLIGGSLGMAIKNRNLAKMVIGVGRNIENLKEAQAREALDYYTTDIREGVREADLVFVCTPILTVVPIAQQAAMNVKKGCIITDVASSKREIVEEMDDCLTKDIFFVGGHPMAGSERSGIKAATKYLLEGTNYVLTKTEKTNEEALQKLKEFLEKLDINVLVMSPKEHDYAVAAISHMPLVIAISLTNTIAELKEHKENAIKLASSGFRDTTRIASGNIEMARDMFLTNERPILWMLEWYKIKLVELETAIKNGDIERMERLLNQAKNFRDSLYGS